MWVKSLFLWLVYELLTCRWVSLTSCPCLSFTQQTFTDDPFNQSQDTPALPPKKTIPPRPKPPSGRCTGEHSVRGHMVLSLLHSKSLCVFHVCFSTFVPRGKKKTYPHLSHTVSQFIKKEINQSDMQLFFFFSSLR